MYYNFHFENVQWHKRNNLIHLKTLQETCYRDRVHHSDLFKLLSRTQHERNVVPHAATLLGTRLDCVPIVAQNLI